MKAQKGGRFEYDCRTDEAGGPDEKSAQTGDQAVRCAEIGCSLPGSIKDEELVLDENGLGDHRTDAARTQESGKSSDDMDEKDDEITHLLIITKPGIAWG